MSAIVCHGLSKCYGTLTTFHDLAMTVPEGSIFGFFGPNGAGKTTAKRILATLSHPTAGEAWVAGASIAGDPAQARRALGYLPQDVAFPKWMSGQEYLEFAAELSGMPTTAQVWCYAFATGGEVRNPAESGGDLLAYLWAEGGGPWP